MSVALRIDDLTVTYDTHPALHHLTGSFAAGSLTAIVGPNGAGKSTLLKTLAGLMRAASGSVDRGGLRAAEFGFLPQMGEVTRDFPLSVVDAVSLGGWRQTGIWRQAPAANARRIAAALEAVGLGGFERRMVGTLSVGQFQRVLFARLIVQDAAVILLDEPFAAVDAATKADLCRLIAGRWHPEGRTVIAVLHDLAEVRTTFPHTLLLAREAIAWGATDTTLTPANLARAKRMAEAWDETAPFCAAQGAMPAVA